MKSIVVTSVFLIALSLNGCASLRPQFSHEIATSPTPWKHEHFDNADDKFTFAIFSDLTGGERERIFEVAVAQLNLLRPEIIVNVGDLINGGTNDTAELHRQWDSFDERVSKARALPGAVLAQQGQHFGGMHIQVDLVVGFNLAEGFADAAQGDERWGLSLCGQLIGHVKRPVRLRKMLACAPTQMGRTQT